MLSTPTPDGRPAAPTSRRFGREVLRQALILLVTLLVVEAALRLTNPAYLKSEDWGSFNYAYDGELGWYPVAGERMHNSLGLRDIEPGEESAPTILFVGDSQVWGANVAASERFTDRLRGELPAYRVVNAGVAGYGTDQEYLLLRRLWDRLRPAIVVLMFECNNDRLDNTSNVRYFSYKPYVEIGADGALHVRGQPPPKSRRLRFRESWLAQYSLLARLAVSAYVEIRYPRKRVPDPTEALVGAMRDFVESRGAKFLVGVQREEPQLETFLKAQAISYTRFDGAQEDSSRHWTPKGHAEVARRLRVLLNQHGIAARGPTQSR